MFLIGVQRRNVRPDAHSLQKHSAVSVPLAEKQRPESGGSLAHGVLTSNGLVTRASPSVSQGMRC
jgi:hypothetical protein